MPKSKSKSTKSDLIKPPGTPVRVGATPETAPGAGSSEECQKTRIPMLTVTCVASILWKAERRRFSVREAVDYGSIVTALESRLPTSKNWRTALIRSVL